MREQFNLNLQYDKNPYIKFYGLTCNPFWPTQKLVAQHAMNLGINKSLISKYVKMFGLSDEVVSILKKATEDGKKYKVVVEDTVLTLREEIIGEG